MSAKSEKLAAVAAEVDVDVATLTQYLHNDLPAMRGGTLIPGHKVDAIMRALTANGEGVFYIILSQDELPAQYGQGQSDYIGAIRAGVRERASQDGYHTLYGVSNKYIADEEFFHHVLEGYPQAGIISIIPESSEALAAACSTLKTPCLLMDFESDDLPDGVHTLNVDNYQGSYDAVRYLIDLGHRRIAYLAGFLTFHSAQARLAGYRDALAQAGIPYDDSIVGEGDWTSETGSAFMSQMLQQTPQPTALVAANDLMATGALIQAKKEGVNVPYEISIIGCDDIPMASSISPTLTTLRQPMKQMGIMAADIVIRVLQRETFDNTRHMLPLELVKRESTAS